MWGLALEGGGAKGAFHIGAVKALLENNYEIKGVAGTSIGAFNAALISQGDFEKCYNLWINMEPSSLFNVEDEHMKKLTNNKIDKETIKYITTKARNLIGNKGIDTSKLRSVIENTVEEEKLRNSQIDFGMVTVSISEFKPLEIYKEDIPKGLINDYIMASANFPGFKLYPIDGKYYIDGGIHDNCPVNLLIRKGYNNIIAVRTSYSDKFSHLERNDVNIINIIASEDLGKALIFDNNLIKRNIKLGYYDTIRIIKNLKGRKFYINPIDENKFNEILIKIPNEIILQVGETLKVANMEPKRMLFERIIPTMASLLNLPITSTYQDIYITLLETIAIDRNIEKFKIYSLEEFLDEIKRTETIKDVDVRKSTYLAKLKKLADDLLGDHMLDELACVFLDVMPNDIK